MERLVASLLLLTFIVHVSSLAIKSVQEENRSEQTNEERKLENDASQLRDIDELRKSYGMLLDNMVAARDHPFGWGIRRYRYDHPYGYNRFGLKGDAKFRRDHPFGFAIARNNRYGDHPFGFGTQNQKLHGKKRDYAPASNTKAFHGKRGADSQVDEQNTSLFHGKRDADLVSEWLDDKIIRGNMRE